MCDNPIDAVGNDLIRAARDCLAASKLLAGLRSIMQQRVPCYEACIDAALAEQLELLSGLMAEYSMQAESEIPYVDMGEEPMTYQDAIRLLDDFMALANRFVTQALDGASFALPSVMIEVRAQTFSALLRDRDEASE